MRPARSLLLLLLGAVAGGAFLLGSRACGPSGRPATRTLVLFTIDTLRRDALGVHQPAGRGPGATPRLDALARAAWTFEDARTPVPLTLPAHVTMLSGLPPARTGVRLNAYGRLPAPHARGFPLLAERLREAGWRTGAFVSAEPLAAERGLDQGFEVYDDGAEALVASESGYVPQRAGEETVSRALAWLRGLGGEAQAFLWVHVFEPHAPYLRYADDVRAADQVAGRLFDGLAALGRQDAALLVTSDHGEMLEELGERTHGFLLGDGVLRVPFLLRVPGQGPARRADPVDLADVAPTLAALAGVAWPRDGGPFSGRDLVASPPPADRVRVAESLYAHHRMRWAQLVSASSRAGTLVERGAGRVGWLASSDEAPASLPQAQDEPAPLVEALAAYKRAEETSRMGAPTDPGPYGGSGAVAPFLSSEENARLPDPYRAIPRARALDDLLRDLQRLRLEVELGRGSTRQTSLLVEQASGLVGADPQNPEAHFLHGLALEVQSSRRVQEAQEAGARESAAAAAAAYGRAFERGRVDADTLARWLGVDAGGREAEALERLALVGAQVRWNTRLWVLKAKLHGALARRALAQRPPDLAEQARQEELARAACEQARLAARTRSERSLVTKACR